MEKIMQMCDQTIRGKKKKKNLKYLRNAEVETIRVDLLNVC